MRHQGNARLVSALGLALLVGAGACKTKETNTAAMNDTATVATSAGSVDNTNAAAVKVTDVDVGRAIGADKKVSDKADEFKPNETIYASVTTEGSAANTALKALWTYENGQVVDSTTKTIAAANPAVTEFHISKPSGFPRGKYKVEVFVNGNASETKEFEVK